MTQTVLIRVRPADIDTTEGGKLAPDDITVNSPDPRYTVTDPTAGTGTQTIQDEASYVTGAEIVVDGGPVTT